MATVRSGNKGALVVVDTQVGVMADTWEAKRVVGNIAHAVERARSGNVPVIWVQHSDEELVRDSLEWEWVPELVPAVDEPVIHKSFNSAFEQTELEGELARLGTTHVVVAGAASNWCIRATAYGALERGYDLTLVSDGHTTESMELDDGATVEASSIIDDLNICMTWVSYPGRTNGAATAGRVDFTNPGGDGSEM